MALIRSCKSLLAPLTLSLLLGGCSREPDIATPATPSNTSSQGSTTAQTQTSLTTSTDRSSTAPSSDTSSSTQQDDETVPVPGSLLEKIQNDPELSELNKFIQAAGLESDFLRATSRTLLAPNNAAFAKIPAEQALSLAQDPELLKQVLRFHLIEEAIDFTSNVTVAGHPIVFGVGPEGQTLVTGGENGGQLEYETVQANNGELHIIDTVLWPSNLNLVDALKVEAKYQKFVEILAASGFQAQLEQKKVYTLFAPNNDAITKLAARMGQAKFDAMMKDEAQLRAMLLPHLHLGAKAPNHFGSNEDLPSLDPNRPLKLRMELEPSASFTVNGRTYGTGNERITKNGILIEVHGTLHDGT